MKLYNQTEIPDKLLQKVLTSAARFIGCDHKDVVIRIVYAKQPWSHGQFDSYDLVDTSWLKGKGSRKLISCKGCICLWVPRYFPKEMFTVLDIAIRIWKVAVHEFAHAVDYHSRRWHQLIAEENRGRGSRRPAWSERPIERSVFDQLYDKGIHDRNADWSKQVKLPRTTQDAIIELGIWYEEQSERSN